MKRKASADTDRHLAVLLVCLVGVMVAMWTHSAHAAPQGALISFTAPNTCVPATATSCPVTSYSLFRDGVLFGTVTGGQTVANFFPADGVYLVGVEPQSALGPGTRVNKSVTVATNGVPGPVITLTISAPCATATPPTCTITVVNAP